MSLGWFYLLAVLFFIRQANIISPACTRIPFITVFLYLCNFWNQRLPDRHNQLNFSIFIWPTCYEVFGTMSQKFFNPKLKKTKPEGGKLSAQDMGFKKIQNLNVQRKRSFIHVAMLRNRIACIAYLSLLRNRSSLLSLVACENFVLL